jgi:hypothetical protein
MRTHTLFWFRVALLQAFAAWTTVATAQVVLDQQLAGWDPDDTYWMAAPFYPSSIWCFSFIPNHNNVTGAGIWLQSYQDTMPWNLTLTLWDNLPNFGNAIASATVPVTQDSFTFGQPVGPATDLFWSPVPVIPGQTYYVQIQEPRDFCVHATPLIQAPPATPNFYCDGSLWQTRYSLCYEIYSVIPEPGSFKLLAYGLAAGTIFRWARASVSRALARRA